MPGYREITLPGETRRPRAAAAPARGRAVAGGWRSVLGGALSGTAHLFRRSPGAVVGSLAGFGAAGFICFNALSHQAGPHPAPILPKVASPASPAPKSAPPRPVAQVESSPARETPKETAKPDVRMVPMTASKPAARDPIAEIIRSDETTASVTPRAEPRAAKAAAPGAKAAAPDARAAAPDASVMQAQRTLSKLGYGPLKPDGLMGPGTRAAIEKFERDRKLPVKGEAAGRTLKALASRAAQG